MKKYDVRVCLPGVQVNDDPKDFFRVPTPRVPREISIRTSSCEHRYDPTIKL